MSVPAYLMGTQTAGLLSPTPPGTQSSVYTPGQGTAPYAPPAVPGAGSVAGGAVAGATGANSGGTFNVANYSGLTEYEKNKLQSLASGQDFFMMDAFMNGIKNKYNSDIPIAHEGYSGDGDMWFGKDPFAGLESNLWSANGGSSGGGGGAGSGGAGAGGGGAGTGQVGGGSGLGGLLNGGGSGIPNTANPNGLNGFPNIPGGNLNPGGTGGQVGGGAGQVGGGGIPGSNLSGGQGGGVPMMQMGAGNALQNYYNTPGYQLTNGQGAVNNFQTSPGYQFAVDQALGQVQRQGASRGLLDSGAGLKAMTDRAQGMANQEFNNWQQNQQNQYNQYQNRLQGLASGPTGADMAYGLGQNVGANNMNVGNNIGSILANQGNSLFGGIVGAGGAQAQNVTQAGNMQAQILGSNLQTQMMLAALAAGQQGARQ